MIIHRRSEWGARPTRPVDHQETSKIGEVFIHHSDSPGDNVPDFAHACAIVRGLQDFHMNAPPRGRGWSDIAYHYVIVQPHEHDGLAWIFEGRPLNVVPAAQLGHNTNTCAICIVQQSPERIMPNTIWRAGRLARRIPSARLLRGHYEVTGTECPGPELRAKLGEIAAIAGLQRAPGAR